MILSALSWVISKFIFILSMKFENQIHIWLSRNDLNSFIYPLHTEDNLRKVNFFSFLHKYCDFHYIERCINLSFPQLTIAIYLFKLFSLWNTRPNPVLARFVNKKPANNFQTYTSAWNYYNFVTLGTSLTLCPLPFCSLWVVHQKENPKIMHQ